MGYAYHTVSLGICRIACLFSAAYSLKLLNYPEKKTEELYPNEAHAQPCQAVKEAFSTNQLNWKLHFKYQDAVTVLVTLHCYGQH